MRAARRYAAPPLQLWRSSSLQKVFGRSRHPVPSVALQGSRPRSRSTRGGLPLASHRVRPSFLRSFTLRIGTMAVTPSASLYSPLQPIADAYRRTFLQGFGASCLRAPGRRRPFAPSRPLQPWAVARLSPRSFRHRRRWTFTLLSIGQHSPAHAPRGRASNAGAPTSCIDPTRKARDRAVAPRPASPPGQPPAGWPKGQRRPP